MQSDGRRFAASQVACRQDDTRAELTLNLAPAYPASAKVKSWIRTVTLVRDRSVEIQDQYALSELVGNTALHFMCAVRLRLPASRGESCFRRPWECAWNTIRHNSRRAWNPSAWMTSA